MFENRLITRREEHAIRLCHHDFENLPKKEAANKMNITVGRLNQVLKSARKKIPTLFPILTPRQATVYKQLSDGWDHYKIANCLEITVRQVGNTVAQLHRLGVPIYHRPRTVRYDVSMDGKILRKF